MTVLVVLFHPDGNCVVAVCLCRQGIADGQADFSFATRINGTLKEMKGALGGLRVVSGDQHEKALKQRVEQVCVRNAHVKMVKWHAVYSGSHVQAFALYLDSCDLCVCLLSVV